MPGVTIASALASASWVLSNRWTAPGGCRPARPHDLRSKRVALTPRGNSAIGVIRAAVGEVEAAWAQQLGPKRFSQLRCLLIELNQFGAL
jgi:hypothetical protein